MSPERGAAADPAGNAPSTTVTDQAAATIIHAADHSTAAQELHYHAAAQAVTEPVAPRQLPPPVRHFAGREAELRALTRLLPNVAETAGTVLITAIDGTAGIGKTALAVYWAHQVAERFGDGQLYVNLRGFDPSGTPMKPAEAVRGFLDAFAVPPQRIPAGLDAQVALYRSLMAGKTMLVVLDNARDAEQVRPLLPGAPGCVAVVTSRNQLTSLVAREGAYPLPLDLLTHQEARDLFTRRLGNDRVAAEPDAAAAIVIRCARLPLALAIVAARAATQPSVPLAALAGELQDTATGLDTLSTGDAATDVRAVFSWSYHALTSGAARLFRLLGLHPGPDTSAAAVASLAGLTPATARPLLTELARAHLIVEHVPGRYTFHDLLRAYATHLTCSGDPAEERQAAVSRALDHYLHTAHGAARLLGPDRVPITLSRLSPGVTPETPTDHGQALKWFTTERPLLLAAIQVAAGAGFDTHVWQLTWTLTDFLRRQGHRRDWAAAGRAALHATQRLADSSAQACAELNVGGADLEAGRFDEAHAHLQHALDLYGKAGDRLGQARSHLNLAMVWERQRCRHADALDHARQALDLSLAAGHEPGQAAALNAVGWFYAQLGDYEQALAYCQRALALLQRLGDRSCEASTWDSLGYAYHHLGDHAGAIACYRRSLVLWRDLGDRNEEATSLTGLGDAHCTEGNPDAARLVWQEALTILNELGQAEGENVGVKLHQLDYLDTGDKGLKSAVSPL